MTSWNFPSSRSERSIIKHLAHAWSSAILSAASLHLSLASPNTRLFEFKPLPNALLRDLVDTPIVQVNGEARVSDRPGLGIEVDEAVVARLAGN